MQAPLSIRVNIQLTNCQQRFGQESTSAALDGRSMVSKMGVRFVTNPLFLSRNGALIAMVNPLAGPDHQFAAWFHAHLTRTFVSVLRALCEPGSSEWIGVVLFCLVVFFAWKRWWPSLVTLIVAVPGGMMLNELVKILVHRPRPFVTGQFVDWSGYSFASGHTIGATLLYGQLALFIVPSIKDRRWRALTISGAVLIVLLVGFSRIALGAHYLTDVMAGIFFGILWLALCLIAGKPMRRNTLPIPVNVLPDSGAVLVPIQQTDELALNPRG
jgi:membrane-associated phospholipid phosphatase